MNYSKNRILTIFFFGLAALSAEAFGQSAAPEESISSIAPLEETSPDDSFAQVLRAVTGLPAVTCVGRPISSYQTGDGCLEFLERNPQYSNKRHAGDDFCAPKDTRVNSIGAGKVMFARAYTACPNWGSLIAIEHLLSDGSSVVSLYGHVVPTVEEGRVVAKGEKIGTVGHFSCWSDHLHFSIAKRDYGSPVGTYASWVKGYLADNESVSPYTSPGPFISARQDCPPVVGNYTYTTSLFVTRTVTVQYSDPEGLAPQVKTIRYQYRDAIGTTRSGSGTFALKTGTAGNGTYLWSQNVYGSQFKFYTEWQDAGSNAVRYPATGWIE